MTYDQYAALVMAHSGLEIADGLKRCTLCDELKPLEAFYANRSNGKRWLASRCNLCHNVGSLREPKIYKNWFHVARRARA